MNVSEIERAARFAWPASEEEELSFGVLRYASGLDRRTNSLSLYQDADLVPVELIHATEKFFGDRNAAPIVRIVHPAGCLPPAVVDVDRALERRGYQKQSPTQTMLLDLANLSEVAYLAKAQPERLVELSPWLNAWYALTGRPIDGLAVHRAILGKLGLNKLMLLNRNIEGVPLSTGMGVLSGRAMGIFGVATAVEHRQQGYGAAVVGSLLSHALMRGARFAYLQVEESNEMAIRLYRRLGFTKIYSHWYRVGKQTANC